MNGNRIVNHKGDIMNIKCKKYNNIGTKRIQMNAKINNNYCLKLYRMVCVYVHFRIYKLSMVHVHNNECYIV